MRLLVQALFVLLLKKCNKIKFLTSNLVYIQTTETEQTMEKIYNKNPHTYGKQFICESSDIYCKFLLSLEFYTLIHIYVVLYQIKRI